MNLELHIWRAVLTTICVAISFSANCSNPWMEDYTYLGSYGISNGACEVYGFADHEGYGVCIELPEASDPHNQFILVRDFELSDFVSSLTQLQNKFEKWIAVAKENNITDYTKKVDINCIDVYGLTTPDSNEGSGLWNCKYFKDLSLFYVLENGHTYIKFNFWGLCEEGEAEGKKCFFRLNFNSAEGIRELIEIIKPENVKSKLGLSGRSQQKRNYDSLFN